MSTKSLQRNQDNKHIYNWIELYQSENCKESQLNLVNYYEGLVKALARRFSKGSYYDEDIFQVGMLGLLGALNRYNKSYGKSFESFAVPTIVGEIKRFIRDKTWSVHVPRRVKELGPKIRKAVEELTNQLQRSPLVKEIADHIGVSEEEVLETMEMGKSYQALSVDRSLDVDQESGNLTLLDIVGEEEVGYERINDSTVLEQAFTVLDEREKRILLLIFYENLSQKETGERLGISQMHVSRLQRKALKKLKQSMQVDQAEII